MIISAEDVAYARSKGLLPQEDFGYSGASNTWILQREGRSFHWSIYPFRDRWAGARVFDGERIPSDSFGARTFRGAVDEAVRRHP